MGLGIIAIGVEARGAEPGEAGNVGDNGDSGDNGDNDGVVVVVVGEDEGEESLIGVIFDAEKLHWFWVDTVIDDEDEDVAVVVVVVASDVFVFVFVVIVVVVEVVAAADVADAIFRGKAKALSSEGKRGSGLEASGRPVFL